MPADHTAPGSGEGEQQGAASSRPEPSQVEPLRVSPPDGASIPSATTKRNIWGNLPADPRALRLSIEVLERVEGLCLHEIENEVDYLESVDLVLHEVRRLQRLPFNLDQRAQAAILADLPASVAQEAGEFYENADAGQRGKMLKREAMAVAWAQVLRPYLIGLRDHYERQARPAPCDEPPKGEDGLPAEGRSPAGAVPEGQAPDPSPTREELQAEIDRLHAALTESERKRVEEVAAERERCAEICEGRATYFAEAPAYRTWTDAARSYRSTAKMIRSYSESGAASLATSSQTTAQEVKNAD